MAHAEEIDQRLNRRKETIIKLQNFLSRSGGDPARVSDSESSNSSDEEEKAAPRQSQQMPEDHADLHKDLKRKTHPQLAMR